MHDFSAYLILRDLGDEVLKENEIFQKTVNYLFQTVSSCFTTVSKNFVSQIAKQRPFLGTPWQAAASRSITGRVAASEETARNVAYRQPDAREL